MPPRIQILTYDASSFSDELYQQCLPLVDSESQIRIQRFFRRDDAVRTLLSRLLPRMALLDHGIQPNLFTFNATKEGKPFVATPSPAPFFYNVSHDNELVAMVHGENSTSSSLAGSLGIDVMRLDMPKRESMDSFIETFTDQLTESETTILHAGATAQSKLEMFFWIWTFKEAYTKALGVGLGFDFRRISVDPQHNIVRVDGKEPCGWKFDKFRCRNGNGVDYVGVAADYSSLREGWSVEEGKWEVQQEDAKEFAEKCLTSLR
ncbi:4'-phosphopantetheinyl transferase [Flagelloscypha sp. PMI_526]|nr:4'-phosphopantetheinyl transferase [Flagelloscypha sp. PMI_526]